MNSIVKNGYQIVYNPTHITCTPTSLADGAYVDDRVADPAEARLIYAVEENEFTGAGKLGKIVSQILTKQFDTKELVIPKMTKAAATALEGLGHTFYYQDGEWSLAGIGMDGWIVKGLPELGAEEVFTISSGILFLLSGKKAGVRIVKNLAIFKLQDNSLFICGLMEKI